MTLLRRLPLALVSTLLLAAGVDAQVPASAPATSAPRAGKVDVITVHGKSLEGNLAGDSPDRGVSVYLPPSYATDRNRRYPVLYLLHGFTDSDERWFGRIQHFVNVPQAADQAIAAGTREFLIVMPNAYTKFAGSMYSNSVVTGDWERYVARDLVSYVDSHYRTMAVPESRGLAGHSMGGYGAWRVGMKYPDVFSVIYALSPCCMVPNLNPQPAAARQGRAGAPPADGRAAGPPAQGRAGRGGRGPADNGLTAEQVRTWEDIEGAGFGTKAQLASAAAWSPNPKKPPFFIDLPTVNGQTDNLILAKWAANAPLAMTDQYIENLKKMKALAIDAGDRDEPIATTVRQLDALLNNYGLAHTYEIYSGDHVSGVAARLVTHTLPFFSKNLSFQAPRK